MSIDFLRSIELLKQLGKEVLSYELYFIRDLSFTLFAVLKLRTCKKSESSKFSVSFSFFYDKD